MRDSIRRLRRHKLVAADHFHGGENQTIDDDDLLPLSALQHVMFCERQFALIHVEQAWVENIYTTEGELLHAKAHSLSREKRPGRTKEFGMPIRSLELGLTGMTDAVEYGEDGRIRIVEYKRGRPKKHRADEVQLCAQAMCIEEMRGISIAEAQLYYGKAKRRKIVALDNELRGITRSAAARAQELLCEGVTPKVDFDEAKCPHCSMLELCMPAKLGSGKRVERYIAKMLKGVDA
jgi:CRISPR-associated exonuclease Cas4